MTATEIFNYFLDEYCTRETRQYLMMTLRMMKLRSKMNYGEARDMFYGLNGGRFVFDRNDKDSLDNELAKRGECLKYLLNYVFIEGTKDLYARYDKANEEWKKFLSTKVKRNILMTYNPSLIKRYGKVRFVTDKKIVYNLIKD